MEIRYHRLGTDSADDPLVFSTPDEPEWGFEPEVSADGRLLVVTIWRGTDPESRIYVADLSGGVEGAVVRPVLDKADAHYEHIATIGRTLYLLTDLDAPLGRVIAVDVDDPANDPGGHPGVRRGPRAGPRRRRPFRGRLPPPRPRPSRDLRARRAPRRGCRAAWDRLDRGAGRPPRRRRALPDVHDLRVAADRARSPDGRRHGPRGPAPGARVGPGRLRHRAGVRDVGRWDAGAALPQPPPRHRPGRRRPDAPPRLRRLPHHRTARGSRRSGSPGWSVAGSSPSGVAPRGRGVRQGLARRRPPREQAERLRRLRRVPAVAGDVRLDAAGADRDQRPLERRAARRRDDRPAPGAVRRGARRGRRDGHAAVPPVHDRLGLDERLRLGRRPGAVPDAVRVLAAPQHPGGRRATRRRS